MYALSILCRLGHVFVVLILFFFQAEDGIRDLVRSRGLGDVYKRQSFTAWGVAFYVDSVLYMS